MPPLVGTFLVATEPDRECWHEAGHGVTGYYLGIPVQAIGFTWNKGENVEPNPSTWSETATADKESVAVHLFGGMAAEILKLKDFDYNARIPDIQEFNRLGCTLPGEHYLQQAMNILKERDPALVRVYNVLMKRRINPPAPRFRDADNVWRQVHLRREEFEALMSVCVA
jgi:hypothetical protein